MHAASLSEPEGPALPARCERDPLAEPSQLAECVFGKWK
jgi:hypothetical protein